jgi:hypothetical protein
LDRATPLRPEQARVSWAGNDEQERPMKAWSRSLGRPSLHLAAVVILAVLAIAAGSALPRLSSPTGPEGHPASCHACAAVRPGAAAAFEAYLVRTGTIDDPNGGE